MFYTLKKIKHINMDKCSGRKYLHQRPTNFM